MNAILCDICKKHISSFEAGARVNEIDNRSKHSTNEMDLCATHYNDFTNLRSNWVKEKRNIASGGGS